MLLRSFLLLFDVKSVFFVFAQASDPVEVICIFLRAVSQLQLMAKKAKWVHLAASLQAKQSKKQFKLIEKS